MHFELCGPMGVNSLGGKSTFIDDNTRKIWIYFLKQKFEVFGVFKNFKALVEKQSGRELKALRFDQGGEYISGEFETFLKDIGIKHELTVSFSPPTKWGGWKKKSNYYGTSAQHS